MKKLLSLALVLTIVLMLIVPAMAATPNGFITGDVTRIDKTGYNNFTGKEITANNSVTKFDNFSFVADNKTLNAWYIDVTDDISGTLEVAYKVGSAYSVVTFDIDGAGKYWIADSRGSTGANMVKIGAFVEKGEAEPVSELYIIAGNFSNSSHSMEEDEFDSLIENLRADGLLQLNLTNGWGPIDFDAYIDLYDGQVVEFEVFAPYYEFEYKGVKYAYILHPESFQLGAWSLGGGTGGFVYTDGVSDTLTGVSFVVEKGSDGYYLAYELLTIVEIIKLEPVSGLTIIAGNFSNSSHSMTDDEFDALIEDLQADGLLMLNLTNGWGPIDFYADIDLYDGQLVEFEVFAPYYEFEYKGIRYAYKLYHESFQLSAWSLSYGTSGFTYTDGVSDTLTGVSFVVEKGSDGYYLAYELLTIVEIIKL